MCTIFHHKVLKVCIIWPTKHSGTPKYDRESASEIKLLHLPKRDCTKPSSQRGENILMYSATYFCQKNAHVQKLSTRILTTYMVQVIHTNAVYTETRHSEHWSESCKSKCSSTYHQQNRAKTCGHIMLV